MNKELIAKIDEWASKQETYDPKPWDLLCYSRDALEAADKRIAEYQIALARIKCQAKIEQDLDRNSAFEWIHQIALEALKEQVDG